MIRLSTLSLTMIVLMIGGLSACNEKTATAPVLDEQTNAAIEDIKRIAEGDTVTFGDIMSIAKMAGEKENQKKLTCGALTAGAQMAAMAEVSGLVSGEDFQLRSIDSHLTAMAAKILPTLENTEVSTLSLQKAMSPVFQECMKYSMDMVSGKTDFQAGRYAPK